MKTTIEIELSKEELYSLVDRGVRDKFAYSSPRLFDHELETIEGMDDRWVVVYVEKPDEKLAPPAVQPAEQRPECVTETGKE